MNDTLYNAIELLISMCGKEEHIEGMEAVKEMLCDINEVEFALMSDDDKEEWVEQYLP